MKHNSIKELVGNTPLVRFELDELPDVNLYIKLEGCNPSGSIKDRAGLYNIQDAIKSGKLKKGMTLLDASSGNMACAVSYYGKILGYKTHLVCGSKLTLDKKQFITYYGATLDMVGDFTIQGNHHCRDVLVPKDSNFYFLDQLHNPMNPKASYETLGPEIYKDLPDVAAVFGSLGSGGSMCGVGSYLKEQREDIKIITAEASSGYKIPGTGAFVDGDYITPFIAQGRREGIFDDSISIELPNAQHRTSQLSSQGFFVGWQTGGVVEAAVQGIKKHGITGNVVCISGDSGWKNIEKLLQ